MLSPLVEQHIQAHSVLKAEIEQWFVPRMHTAGYDFLALIYELGTQFANRYVPYLLDRYSVATSWDTGPPNSPAFSM